MDAREAIFNLRKAYVDMADEEREKLWDILTALRGPDNGEQALKVATTGLIRAATLGYIAGQRLQEFATTVTFADNIQHMQIRESQRRDSDNFHFLAHARGAFRALGLRWNDDNGVVAGILRWSDDERVIT